MRGVGLSPGPSSEHDRGDHDQDDGECPDGQHPRTDIVEVMGGLLLVAISPERAVTSSTVANASTAIAAPSSTFWARSAPSVIAVAFTLPTWATTTSKLICQSARAARKSATCSKAVSSRLTCSALLAAEANSGTTARAAPPISNNESHGHNSDQGASR